MYELDGRSPRSVESEIEVEAFGNVAEKLEVGAQNDVSCSV